MPAPTQAVESFSVRLDDYTDLINVEEPVQAIEERLLQRLESPVRLLRWAIVRVEASACWCEGAYLKDV
jgi:hypothetical protein